MKWDHISTVVPEALIYTDSWRSLCHSGHICLGSEYLSCCRKEFKGDIFRKGSDDEFAEV
jgi:hypothetical protein